MSFLTTVVFPEPVPPAMPMINMEKNVDILLRLNELYSEMDS